jgi:two-component system OmpR family sensor kinase
VKPFASVKARLALSFALGAAAVLAGSSLLFVSHLRSVLILSVDSGLQARADNLVHDLGDNLERLKQEDAGAGGPVVPPGEALAQVVGADGSLLESSDTASPRPLLTGALLARATKATVTVTTATGPHTRLLARPVPGTGGKYVVIVGSPLATVDKAVRGAETSLAVGGVPLVCLAGLAAWLLAGAALRPVERMRREVADMSENDLEGRVGVPGTGDELAALAKTMNDLLVRMQQTRARERSFVADAGHELRTPLAILRGELELASRPGRSIGELQEAVAVASEETERLGRLAEDLLLLAQRDESMLVLRRQATDPAIVLAQAVQAVRAKATRAQVTVSLDAPTPMVAEIDPDRLRQAVDNLLDNALRFAPAGSEVVVRLAPVQTDVVVAVDDAGPGFPEAFLARAFERFARSDASRVRDAGGSGLGLAIVAAIAAAHGGHAEAANRTGGGAAVSIVLPMHADSPVPESAGGKISQIS